MSTAGNGTPTTDDSGDSTEHQVTDPSRHGLFRRGGMLTAGLAVGGAVSLGSTTPSW